MGVACVGGIERAAEEADAHAGISERQALHQGDQSLSALSGAGPSSLSPSPAPSPARRARSICAISPLSSRTPAPETPEMRRTSLPMARESAARLRLASAGVSASILFNATISVLAARSPP